MGALDPSVAVGRSVRHGVQSYWLLTTDYWYHGCVSRHAWWASVSVRSMWSAATMSPGLCFADNHCRGQNIRTAGGAARQTAGRLAARALGGCSSSGIHQSALQASVV